jgi:myosin-15
MACYKHFKQSCWAIERGYLITLNRYVSDHGYNGYKAVCQRKLLQSSRIEWQLARNYPPCLLEWRSNRKRVNIALQIYFADGEYLLISGDNLNF